MRATLQERSPQYRPDCDEKERVQATLREKGPEALQKEIAELYNSILIRIDVLSSIGLDKEAGR